MVAERRILILGSSERFGRAIRAYSWRALPVGLNVADYDTVILNFSELEDEETRTNVPLDRVPSSEQFARLMFSEGATIIAVGDPSLSFGSEQPSPFGESMRMTYTSATWWIPVGLPVKQDSGEAIQNVAPNWTFWFDHVRRFDWHFWNRPTPVAESWKLEAARAALPWAATMVARWSPLAETRYGDPLGVELEVAGMRETRPASSYASAEYQTESTPARIVWLPPPTELASGEAITLLLREVVGVRIEVPKPDWVARFALPREQETARDVLDRERELENAQAALRLAEESHAAESRFARLLYETGKEALEPVVRERSRCCKHT